MCGHNAAVNQLCFTARGHELVTASDDHKIKVCHSAIFRLWVKFCPVPCVAVWPC